MAMTVRMIMILLYGAGEELGRGEIPMRWFSKPLLSDFPFRGRLGQILKTLTLQSNVSAVYIVTYVWLLNLMKGGL